MATVSDLESGWETEGVYYYQARVDESISEAVVQAVASVSGQSPTPLTDTGESREDGTLDPLYKSINPDALDSLFDSIEETSQPAKIVEFRYCEYEVTVESTGVVTVTET